MSTSFKMPLFMNHKRSCTKSLPAKLQSRGDPIRIACHPQHSVAVWLGTILTSVSKAGLRGVLVRLVSALFRVGNRAADFRPEQRQLRGTVRKGFGDFSLGSVSYHVADVSTGAQMQSCKKDLQNCRFPVLWCRRQSLARHVDLLTGPQLNSE